MFFITTGWRIRDAGFHDRECGHEQCRFTLLAVWILAREGAESAGSVFQIIVAVESSGFQVRDVVFEIGVGCGWAKCLLNFLRGCLLIMECARDQVRLYVCERRTLIQG